MRNFSRLILLLVLCFSVLFVSTPIEGQTTACPTPNATTPANVTGGLITTGGTTQQLYTDNTGGCVSGATSKVATYKLPTYADLKSTYFTQAKCCTATLGGAGPFNSASINAALGAQANGMAVLVPGTLNVTSAITGSYSAVIFVDGDLNIGTPSDTLPGGASNTGQLTYGSGTAGLVFVVSGNINIDKSVTHIDAVLISGGQICTAYDGATLPPGCPSSGYTAPVSNTPLVINGSLISLTTIPAQRILLKRQTFDNSQPAEQINTQPKYLVILKNLFTQPLSITSTVTDLGIGTLNVTLVPSGTNFTLDATNHASFNLTWHSDASAQNCTASSTGNYPSFSGAVTTNGTTTITVSSAGTYSYSLTCQTALGATGQAQTAPITVAANPNQITFSPSTIVAGQTGTVTFTVPSILAGDLIALYSASGTNAGYISKLPETSCSVSAGTGTCSYIVPEAPGGAQLGNILPTGPYEIRYLRSDLTPAAITSPFTIKCTGASGACP